MKRRTIFVTGATGFLGGHFLELAKGRSWRLRCLARTPPTSARRANVEWVKGDLTRPGAWEKKLEGCSILLHMATLSLPECEKDPQLGGEIIMGGLERLMDAAARAGIQRRIILSTAEVYGIPAQLPIAESAPLSPLSIYGFLKACGDLYALRRSFLEGFSLCILRLFNLYGAAANGYWPSSVVRNFAQFIQTSKPVVLHRSLRNSRDFLHVSDAARAVWLAIDRPKAGGIINIGSGSETRLKKIAEILAQFSGHRLEIDFRPKEGSFRRARAEIRRARRELLFKPKVTLECGLREVLDATSHV